MPKFGPTRFPKFCTPFDLEIAKNPKTGKRTAVVAKPSKAVIVEVPARFPNIGGTINFAQPQSRANNNKLILIYSCFDSFPSIQHLKEISNSLYSTGRNFNLQ